MDATNFLSPSRRPRTADRLGRAANWLGSVAAWLGACLERSRQRHHLADLGDHLLEDVGLSRADVARECGRWPWDGPPTAKLGRSSLGPIRRPSAR
jgi:uncharacterized protein YjiS (DUF1127 family)